MDREGTYLLDVSGRVSVLFGFPFVHDDSAVLLRPPGSTTGRREEEHGALCLTSCISLCLSAKFTCFYSFFIHAKAMQWKTCNFALICGFIQLERNDSEMTISLLFSVCQTCQRLTCYMWASHTFSESACFLHYVNMSSAVLPSHALLISIWIWFRSWNRFLFNKQCTVDLQTLTWTQVKISMWFI